MTTLSLSLIKEQSFAATKPRLFFPFKGILPEQYYVFYLDQKLKSPMENFSGALKGEERRRGEGERGNE